MKGWRGGGGGSLAQSESGPEPTTTSLASVSPNQVSPAAEEASSDEGWKVLNRLRRHFGSAWNLEVAVATATDRRGAWLDKSAEAFPANIMTVKVLVLGSF